MKISVNMIIGDREEPYLKYALESVKWADEFIIVDTSHKPNKNHEIIFEFFADDTKNYFIAEYFEEHEKFDFATARNMALENSEGDFILKIDADEVYYDSFENTVRGLKEGDIFQVEFYHFMLDVFHYQYVEKKQVLFRRDCFKWSGTTHEILEFIPSEQRTYPLIVNLQDKFCHLGYAQPQNVIFDKWKQYVEIEGRPEWYDGQDPDHILDDRKMVSQKFNYEYPEAIRDDIKSFPVVITEEVNRMAKVGLVLVNPELEAIKEIERTADFPISLVVVTNNPAYYADCGHSVVHLGRSEQGGFTDGASLLMTDPDIRWIGISSSGRVKKAIDAMVENVGMVNFDTGFVVSVEVFERIGLVKNNDFEEFQARLRKNNMKVEAL